MKAFFPHSSSVEKDSEELEDLMEGKDAWN